MHLFQIPKSAKEKVCFFATYWDFANLIRSKRPTFCGPTSLKYPGCGPNLLSMYLIRWFLGPITCKMQYTSHASIKPSCGYSKVTVTASITNK